jgi:TolB-like protein
VVTRATLRGGRRVGVLGPSTTSTFHWRTLIDTIAMRTGASYALSGIIRKRDGRLRVFAQLIRSSDRAHVWVDRWADSSAAPTGASEFAIAMADSVIWIVMHPNESRPLPK